ncbi:MAG: hypothetical protein ACK5O9_07300 [Holosporales bacterium]|jgi:hypothetical protein
MINFTNQRLASILLAEMIDEDDEDPIRVDAPEEDEYSIPGECMYEKLQRDLKNTLVLKKWTVAVMMVTGHVPSSPISLDDDLDDLEEDDVPYEENTSGTSSELVH